MQKMYTHDVMEVGNDFIHLIPSFSVKSKNVHK